MYKEEKNVLNMNINLVVLFLFYSKKSYRSQKALTKGLINVLACVCIYLLS